MNEENDIEFVDEDDAPLDASITRQFSQAVLYSSDWTVETIVSQLSRGNIELNPNFQRRDAWPIKSKSRFIESLILGLPIPQLVLAERPGSRGRYIVLDGKQRLLSLLQFTGQASGPNNNFALSGLEIRNDLSRLRFARMQERAEHQDDFNAFLNHTIRTVVIRNWPSLLFLHLVFLRLNTGSMKLSPQELRQALIPGEFSVYIDQEASKSNALQRLLSRNSPDPRMRDVEILVRFLSFRNFIEKYNGRMKPFIDDSYKAFSENWDKYEPAVASQIEQFEQGVLALIEIFGSNGIARKPGSSSFNRAIFDALIFYAHNQKIRDAMRARADQVRNVYLRIMDDNEFAQAIESDTAGIPNTVNRLEIWGAALQFALDMKIATPTLLEDPEHLAQRRIVFSGFS